MHDGSEDPTVECSICGEEVWYGLIKRCSECDNSYCEECIGDAKVCKTCDVCGEMVCVIVVCKSCTANLCKGCQSSHVCS